MPKAVRGNEHPPKASEETDVQKVTEEKPANLKEYYGPLMGITSFAALRAAEEAQKRTNDVHNLAYDFERLVGAIMQAPEGDKVQMMVALAEEFKGELLKAPEGDKVQMMVALAEEFKGELLKLMGNEDTEYEEGAAAEKYDMAEYDRSATVLGLDGANSIDFAWIPAEARRLAESAALGAGPVKVRVAFLEPGWGNSEDNNYYPREVIGRDAHVFKGVKMYATNHKEAEKSVRTEVGTVLDCPVGFTESGAPIALVGVHNPIMAQDIRNRAQLGVLEKLEVSILGNGLRRRGKVAGKAGNVVEAITEGIAIDFVTKAGAGGRAVALVESEKGARDVGIEVNGQVIEADKNECPYCHKPIEDGKVVEAQPITPANLREAGNGQQISLLAESEVGRVLAASRLPKLAVERLVREQYLDAEALMEAIRQERAYIRELTGSGQPTHNDPQPQTETEMVQVGVGETALKEHFGRLDTVNSRWLGGAR